MKISGQQYLLKTGHIVTVWDTAARKGEQGIYDSEMKFECGIRFIVFIDKDIDKKLSRVTVEVED